MMSSSLIRTARLSASRIALSLMLTGALTCVMTGVLAGLSPPLSLGFVTGAKAETTPAQASLPDNLPLAYTGPGNYLAGYVADMDGDFDAASIYYSIAAANDPDNAQLTERAFVLNLAAGRIEDALSFGKVLSQSSATNSPVVSLAMAVNAMSKGRYKTAALLINPGTRKGGLLEQITNGVISGWARMGQGDLKGALERLPAQPKDPWISFFNAYHKGLMLDMAGKSEEAAVALKTAVDLDGDRATVHPMEAYARALWRSGKKDEANKYIEDILARVPGLPTLKAVQAAFRSGAPVAPMVYDAREGAAEVLTGLGQVMAREDTRAEQAAIYLQLALALDPQADTARLTLAEIFQKVNQFESANRQLTQIGMTSPFRHAADIRIAYNDDQMNRVDEAAARLIAMLQANPQDFQVAIALGDLMRFHQKFADAEKAYDKAVAARPFPGANDWEIFYARGISRERQGNWSAAEPDFLKALELSPNQPEILNYLAYTWVDKGLNLDKALPMLVKAVAGAPTDGYIVDSLGWAYFRLGRYDDAVKTLEQAADLKPGDPTINEHLGDAYFRAGRKLEAHYQWRKARDLKPTEPGQLEGILTKLKEGLPDTPKPATAATDAPATQAPGADKPATLQ